MKISDLILKIFISMQLSIGTAFADNADEIFEGAIEKTDGIRESLQGPVAMSFFGVLIAIAGIACAMGKLSKEWAMKIVGGLIITGMGTYVTGYFFS